MTIKIVSTTVPVFHCNLQTQPPHGATNTVFPFGRLVSQINKDSFVEGKTSAEPKTALFLYLSLQRRLAHRPFGPWLCRLWWNGVLVCRKQHRLWMNALKEFIERIVLGKLESTAEDDIDIFPFLQATSSKANKDDISNVLITSVTIFFCKY